MLPNRRFPAPRCGWSPPRPPVIPTTPLAAPSTTHSGSENKLYYYFVRDPARVAAEFLFNLLQDPPPPHRAASRYSSCGRGLGILCRGTPDRRQLLWLVTTLAPGSHTLTPAATPPLGTLAPGRYPCPPNRHAETLRVGLAVLTRISHRLVAAAADSTASPRLSPSGRLDVLSGTPAVPPAPSLRDPVRNAGLVQLPVSL